MAKPGEEVAIVCLRATFGNAANPSLFSNLSEMGTDLANQILNLPKELKLPASQYDSLIGEPIIEDNDASFGIARRMVIEPIVN
jgi:hypothetical protein